MIGVHSGEDIWIILSKCHYELILPHEGITIMDTDVEEDAKVKYGFVVGVGNKGGCGTAMLANGLLQLAIGNWRG